MARGIRSRLLVVAVASCAILALGLPAGAAAAARGDQLTADLDGAPIPLKQVGDWYCEDFAYPAVHCFSNPKELEQRTSAVLAATGVTYVIVYDYAGFAGSYMYMSQDYTVLATLGWNDRISSYVAVNGQSGTFYVDWFYLGTPYGFCCNQQATYLGSYDNSFSSVHRN